VSQEKGLEEGQGRGLEEGQERVLEEDQERGLEEGQESCLEDAQEKGLEDGQERGLEEGQEKNLDEGLANDPKNVPLEVSNRPMDLWNQKSLTKKMIMKIKNFQVFLHFQKLIRLSF